MPELPEVETIRRQLAAALPGLTFAAVERSEPAMLRDCGDEQLRKELPGRRIETVERLGKFMVLCLSGRAFLTMHLGMTGQILIDPSESTAHTRFLFELRNDTAVRRRLEFRDTRKFGRLHLTYGEAAPRLQRWVPTPGWASGTRPIWSTSCAGEGRRSKLSCLTRDTSRASGTSTPTRLYGGRRLRRRARADRFRPWRCRHWRRRFGGD
jgi:formamidopyrimidine-DNA glycosylase